MIVTVAPMTTACVISRMTVLGVELVSLAAVLLVLHAPTPTEVQVFVTVTTTVYIMERPPSPPSQLEPRSVQAAQVCEQGQGPASP